MLHASRDSFTYGYELSDCPTNIHPTPSMLTYSALNCKPRIGLHCLAQGYASNNGILRQIKLADVEFEDTCVVMWTYPHSSCFYVCRRPLLANYSTGRGPRYWENVDLEPHSV